jgi:hypothetical protein
MHTVGHDPKAFREPVGFVDTLVLLTLASAIVMGLITLVTVAVLLL